MPNNIKSISKWSKIFDDVWEFRYGHIVWSSVIYSAGKFNVLNAGMLGGKHDSLSEAKLAAEKHWEVQDVTI